MMKKKNIVMVTMLVVVAVMSIAYALFASNLNITSTGSILSSWNVEFINITNDTPVGSATNIGTPSYTATTATMSADLKLPGDSITYRITLKNNGEIPAIIEDIDATATGSGAIIFSISGLNIGEKLASKEEKVVVVKIEYDPDTTSQPEETSKTLTVSIKAVQDTGQDIDEQAPEVIQGTYLKKAILRDNITYADNVRSEFVNSDKGIDFSQISSDTNGKGLYYTSKNTEGNGTTYYFRGDVDNNYVVFGKEETYSCTYNGETVYIGLGASRVASKEECLSTPVCSYSKSDGSYVHYVGPTTEEQCLSQQTNHDGTQWIWTNEMATLTTEVEDIYWRIVRINEDGSIRIVKQDNAGRSKFNDVSVYNAYVGYMYGLYNQTGDNAYNLTHSNNNPSTIKTYIDNWYTNYTNLSNYKYSHLADAGYCNDRSVAPSAGIWSSDDTALGYGKNTTIYGAYNRVVNLKQPQFACPNASNDLFTTSASSKGNKALTNPVGLLTADEVLYAGGVYLKNNANMYLTNSSTYWTMSPHSVGGTYGISYSLAVGEVGNAIYFSTNGARSQDVGGPWPIIYDHGVRPVINLQSEVQIISGDGTIGSPYIII